MATMRAGDRVRHLPSGEKWILSTNPEDGDITWYGWPEGWAKESDCVLVRACTDEEHRKALEEWGAVWHGDRNSGQPDIRHKRARRQLCDLNREFIESERLAADFVVDTPP